MSDERDLTPEQEARVARLLADARADEPVPPQVAARLDRVLEGLKDEQITAPGRQIAPVIDLAARRKRRAATLLVAAAAVVVAAVGVGQVVGPDDSGDDSSAAVHEDEGGAPDSLREALPSAGGSALNQAELAALGPPSRITAKSFAADVRRLQDRAGVSSEAAGGTMLNGDDLTAADSNFSCGTADYGDGKLMAVYYQGKPAVLAYRAPAGDHQVVDLLQCGSGEPIRSTTIPLP